MDPILGPVVLRVADMARALAFWEGIVGLSAVTLPGGALSLGPAGESTSLLVLEPRPDAVAAPPGSTGLYHLALLVPDRAALGRALVRLDVAGAARHFVGASDHLVSEALYFQDPEGNGLEIYADRPRSEWKMRGGEIAMATEPLDLQALVLAAGEVDPEGPAIPPGTVLGHVHLRVDDLERTADFYRTELGMEVMVKSYPGALFLAWNGYHHHLGLNTWGGRTRTRPPLTARGLVGWDVHLPSAGEPRVLEDPDGVRVRVAGDRRQPPNSPISG